MAQKDWLVDGDRHSRYFHRTMKARKSRGKIFKIKDALGVWIEEGHRIQQLFINDFTSRFKSAHDPTSPIDINLPLVASEEDNFLLLQPLQDHEIKDAIFQVDKFKTCLLYTSPSPRD